jgi:hypothetical protein
MEGIDNAPSEISNCSQYLLAEIKILERTTRLSWSLETFDAYCKISNTKELKFGHNRIYAIHGDKTLIVSYHPSRRNTWQMWISIFETARSIITPEEKNIYPKKSRNILFGELTNLSEQQKGYFSGKQHTQIDKQRNPM